MNSTVSAFLPLRKGSQRVAGKNTRRFTRDNRSLFELKMGQICALQEFEQVVVSTDDDEVKRQAEPFINRDSRVFIDERHPDLCAATTRVQDLIDYVPEILDADHIFWLHATSPFVGQSHYAHALAIYEREVLSGSHDSLMSVNKLQQFIWDDQLKKVINVDRSENPWPNTQDLVPLFEINHAFYINSRDNYLGLRDRIGRNPALFECSGLQKIDIDWQSDFDSASAIHAALADA